MQQIREELTATSHIFRNRVEDLANYSNLKVRYDKLKQNNLNDIYDWIKRFPSKMVSNTNGHYINFQQIPTLDLDGLPKSVVNDIERFQKVYDELKVIEQGNHTDKEIIRAIGAYNRLGSVYFSYNYNFDNFKEVVSSLGKIQRSLFQNRGYDENTDIDLIREELIKELEAADLELEEIKTEEFQDKIYNEIVEKKQKFGIEGKSIAERVKDFAKLNNLLDYKFEKSSAEACSIPTGKFTSGEVPTNTNKIKRLRIAKAKAKAILIQLELAA